MARHFLKDDDLKPQEIWELFKLTERLKMELKSGIKHELLRGKTLVMFFEKPSTRTRLSFEIAMTQLGGHAIYFDRQTSQLGRGETLADTARVISRYADALMARVYKQATLEELAKHSTVPVINGLSDLYHPCQALADYFTIYEKFSRVSGVKVAYVGDGNNNVTHSLLLTGSLLGANVSVASPEGYEPLRDIVERAKGYAKESGSEIEIVNDPFEAVKGADVVYTDVWVSMGRESEKEEREKVFRPYQVNAKLMKAAKPQAIFMHCLPAHRGQEVVDEVIDSERSAVWDEAENRLHVQKALLVYLIKVIA